VDVLSPIQTQFSAAHNDNNIGLYANSAKAVRVDRKYIVLANSYTPPPEYDFKKGVNDACAFMGDLLCGAERYIVFCERPFVLHRQQHEKDKQKSAMPPWKNFCGRRWTGVKICNLF